jgi:hypothetical protein
VYEALSDLRELDALPHLGRDINALSY